jgi:hypothetical protein
MPLTVAGNRSVGRKMAILDFAILAKSGKLQKQKGMMFLKNANRKD